MGWGGLALQLAVRHWRIVLLAALVGFICWKLVAHFSADHAMEVRAITAEGQLAALQASLADAKAAADKAKAETAAAEKAAQKRLQAARKEWQRIYDAKPENRAWADSPLPADVERRLREQ